MVLYSNFWKVNWSFLRAQFHFHSCSAYSTNADYRNGLYVRITRSFGKGCVVLFKIKYELRLFWINKPIQIESENAKSPWFYLAKNYSNIQFRLQKSENICTTVLLFVNESSTRQIRKTLPTSRKDNMTKRIHAVFAVSLHSCGLMRRNSFEEGESC